MEKEKFVKMYESLQDECLAEAGKANSGANVQSAAAALFGSRATAEHVAGFYMKYYGDEAFAKWMTDFKNEMSKDKRSDENMLFIPEQIGKVFSSGEAPELYGVRITYSWGEDEPVIECGSREEAWKKAKEMAFNEAEEAGMEHNCFIGVQCAPDSSRIVLNYQYDETFAYYDIVKCA